MPVDKYITKRVDELDQGPALSFAVALCRRMNIEKWESDGYHDLVVGDEPIKRGVWDACSHEIAWETMEEEWIDPRFNVDGDDGQQTFSGINRNGKLQKGKGATKALAMNRALIKGFAGEEVDIPEFLLE